MTQSTDFSEQDWRTILEGPPAAGLIVLMAQSGGTFKETWALSKSYVEARQQHGESQLLDEIVSTKPKMDHTRYHSHEELQEAGSGISARRSRCCRRRPRRRRWKTTGGSCCSSATTSLRRIASTGSRSPRPNRPPSTASARRSARRLAEPGLPWCRDDQTTRVDPRVPAGPRPRGEVGRRGRGSAGSVRAGADPR